MSIARESTPAIEPAFTADPAPARPAVAPDPLPSGTPTPHRFTVANYEEMVARGILTEQHRVELIRGEILEKMTIGDRHAACVDRLNRLLNRALGDDVIIRIQNPVQLPHSVPEPDVALLRARDDFYASGKPTAADVLLIIEVADTSLPFDRSDKAELYARAAIAEYWLVNLIDNALERHTRPDPERGLFALREVLPPDARIEASSVPNLAFAVNEILAT